MIVHPSGVGGNGVGKIVLVLALFWIVVALVAPVLMPYGAEEITPAILEPPSKSHWFGTDVNGMDIFSRTFVAARIDLFIGLSATLLAATAGLAAGAMAGGLGKGGSALLRVSDVFQSFPVFILALSVMTLAGRNLANLIFVIGIVNAPLYARLTFAQASRIRSLAFVDAARISGVAPVKIVMKRIIPHTIVPLIAQGSMTVGWAILLTAGLSFVGAGVRPPTPEWGAMIALGARNMVTGQWWPALFPGLALGLAIWSFSNVGEWLVERWGETAV